MYDPRYLAGIVLFNRGDFFEAHEVWEQLWMEPGEDKKFFQGLIQAAVALNEKGAPARAKPKPKPALRIPPYFMTAVRKNKKALKTFDAFPPSHKREYVEWVAEAKQEETRKKRLETAVAWMAEGKKRNWKYEKC